jgi:hypothetical protein
MWMLKKKKEKEKEKEKVLLTRKKTRHFYR